MGWVIRFTIVNIRLWIKISYVPVFISISAFWEISFIFSVRFLDLLIDNLLKFQWIYHVPQLYALYINGSICMWSAVCAVSSMSKSLMKCPLDNIPSHIIMFANSRLRGVVLVTGGERFTKRSSTTINWRLQNIRLLSGTSQQHKSSSFENVWYQTFSRSNLYEKWHQISADIWRFWESYSTKNVQLDSNDVHLYIPISKV